MTPPARTIDLGQLPRDRQPEPDAPWPVLVRLRRWHTPRRTGRLAGAAGAAALLLLAGTAAAGPARPVFAPHFTVPAVTSYAHDAQRLYAIDTRRPNLTRLTAYRLSDGTVPWQRPLPSGAPGGVELWNGVLVVWSGDAGAIIAVDPDTGRQLWRQASAGPPTRIAQGRWLLRDAGSGESAAAPDAGYAAVDPVTGQTAWTAAMPGVYHALDLDARYLVTYDPEHGLSSYDLTTGERVAQLPVSPVDFDDLRVAGSRALLADGLLADSPLELTGYDVATLTPQWTATGLGRGRLFADRCGELLCLAGERRPRALDPATGELVWSMDWLPAGDQGEIFTTVTELPGAGLAGYLLVTEYPRQHSWLADATTGEPVLDLDQWTPYPSGLAAAAVPGPEPPLLFRSGEHRMLVGQLRPDRSGIRLLGAVDAPPGSPCTPVPGFVLCRELSPDPTRPHELTVWRHRLA